MTEQKPTPESGEAAAQAQPETATEEEAVNGAAEAEDEATEPPRAAESEACCDADPDDAADNAALEIAALKDRLLRAVAETENVRKRGTRERKDAARYAITDFARDMAGVADDLARALEAPPAALGEVEEASSFLEGLELTRRNLEAALGRHGITRIDPAGEPFDHNYHEALFELDAAGAEPGTVIQVVRAGYRIHDRLLRAAQVGVARRQGGANSNGASQD